MSVFPKAWHGNPHAGAVAVRLSFLAAKRGNSSLHWRGRENPVLRTFSAPADFRWRESTLRLCASLFITRCGRFRSLAKPILPCNRDAPLNSTPWTAYIYKSNRWLRYIVIKSKWISLNILLTLRAKSTFLEIFNMGKMCCSDNIASVHDPVLKYWIIKLFLFLSNIYLDISEKLNLLELSIYLKFSK